MALRGFGSFLPMAAWRLANRVKMNSALISVAWNQDAANVEVIGPPMIWGGPITCGITSAALPNLASDQRSDRQHPQARYECAP